MPNVSSLVRQRSLHRLFIQGFLEFRRDYNSRSQQTHGYDSVSERRVTQRQHRTHHCASAQDGERSSRNENQHAHVGRHRIGLR